MKSIEQLLQLSKNHYYQFSDEEQAELDAFLSKQSGRKTPAKKTSTDSEKNIPATVINKNVVKKETGEIPTVNNVAERQEEASAAEEAVHADAVNNTPDAS